MGRRIGTNPNRPWMEIVGVVADTRWRNPGLPPQPEYFKASGQGVGGSLTILARTSLDEGSVARALRALLEETDPTDVIRLVVGQGLRLLGFGLLLDVEAALVGSRLLTGLLYETSPWDFITTPASWVSSPLPLHSPCGFRRFEGTNDRIWTVVTPLEN